MPVHVPMPVLRIELDCSSYIFVVVLGIYGPILLPLSPVLFSTSLGSYVYSVYLLQALIRLGETNPDTVVLQAKTPP